MERRGIEIKVGLFVLIAIAVAAGMILKFGKSGRVSGDSFYVTARFDEVGGIIRGASAFYQGVLVGSVADISLDEESSKVLIKLSFYSGTRIPENARFEIRQVGLLGDKVVSILPTHPASKTMLKPNAVVDGVVPSDIGNLAERAGGLIQQISEVISRINTELLKPDTMTNVRATIANTASATAEATAAIKEIRDLLKANRAAVDEALKNFAALTAKIESASTRADGILEENAPKIKTIVANVEKTSDDLTKISESLKETAANVDAIIAKIEKGEGAVGLLLSDEKTRADLKAALENLSAFSENVRKRGILWYKDVSTQPAPAPRPQPSGSRTSGAPAPREGNRGIIYTKPPRDP
jgi:phospholipid/cholesterol/gamma-HCH transport system substrate-binding protein